MKKIILLSCVLLLKTQAGFTQAGMLDVSFNGTGLVHTDFSNSDEEAFAVAVQPNGKILLAGYSMCCSNAEDFAVIRYNADGSLDNTFGSGGKVSTDFNLSPPASTDIAHSIAIQSDGKIILAGQAFNGHANDFALARYDASGNPDNTFGSGGKVITNFGLLENSSLHALMIQPDGKIIAAGSAKSGDDFVLVRYKNNGSIDSSFGNNGIVLTNLNGGDQINAMALQTDGKILAAGRVRNAAWYDSSAIVRYTSNGTIDSSFGVNGRSIHMIGIDAGVESIALQSDGKIVIAGGSNNGSLTTFYVARFNPNGQFDNSFAVNGIATTDFMTGKESFARSVMIQSDGKILAAGTANSSFLTTLSNNNFAMARYLPNGALDSTFGVYGKDTTDFGLTPLGGAKQDYGYALALAPDGKIILGGTSALDFAVARYKNDLTTNLPSSNDELFTFTVFPNPCYHQISIQYSMLNNESISCQLKDLNGNIIQTFLLNEFRFKGTHREDFIVRSDIPAGSYQLVLTNELHQNCLMLSKSE